VVLFAGWAIDNHGAFDLNRPPKSDEFIAALGLLFISLCYGVSLVLGLHVIYKRFKLEEASRTVLPHGFAILSASAMAVAIIGIATLMSVR
jgi:hypothetical protein